MTLVSVAVCCYNSEKHLDQMIQSVLNQTYKEWELILVNDGSTDRTEEIVQSYIHAGYPIIYHHQLNKGLGAARNECVRLANGDYIALIDHDDLCLPNRLEEQVALAESHPEVGLFFSNTEHFLDNGMVLRRQFDSFDVDPCSLDLSAGEAANQLLIHGCFIDTESVMFRRDIVQRVEGFNPAYRCIVDYDFFLRVGERFSLLGDPQILARWRIHAPQATQTMRETMTLEAIELLRTWLEKPSLSAKARRSARLQLWEGLIRYSMLLLARRRVRDAVRRLLEAARIQPGFVDTTGSLLKRCLRRIAL